MACPSVRGNEETCLHCQYEDHTAAGATERHGKRRNLSAAVWQTQNLTVRLLCTGGCRPLPILNNTTTHSLTHSLSIRLELATRCFRKRRAHGLTPMGPVVSTRRIVDTLAEELNLETATQHPVPGRRSGRELLIDFRITLSQFILGPRTQTRCIRFHTSVLLFVRL